MVANHTNSLYTDNSGHSRSDMRQPTSQGKSSFSFESSCFLLKSFILTFLLLSFFSIDKLTTCYYDIPSTHTVLSGPSPPPDNPTSPPLPSALSSSFSAHMTGPTAIYNRYRTTLESDDTSLAGRMQHPVRRETESGHCGSVCKRTVFQLYYPYSLVLPVNYKYCTYITHITRILLRIGSLARPERYHHWIPPHRHTYITHTRGSPG